MKITLETSTRNVIVDGNQFDVFVNVGGNTFVFSNGNTHEENLSRAFDYARRYVAEKIDLRAMLEDIIKNEFGYFEI